MLETVASVVILIGAVCVAVSNIWKFFANGRKGIQDHVNQAKEIQNTELTTKVDERIKLVVGPMLEQQARTLTGSFGGLLDKHLPERFLEHDQAIRKQYLGDRMKYLNEIKDEVVAELADKIKAVETHEEQMHVFTEVLKELLRERIMEIYRRNKHKRELEEHERFELNQAYASYKSIKGNSYIDGYYETMCDWSTVPDVKLQ